MELIAKQIAVLDDWNGDARLYKLSVPLAGYGNDEGPYEHVVVSAVITSCSGPETYIFGCDNMGNVHSYLDLPGSYRGGLNHQEALRRAGYEICL